ncbi:hypothetical protein BCF53_11374 [Reinekea marinisedimentorum]|uniref:Uncharacterized protein n=1 Tax=Reinekea marinisedimentorum TaxID=230495 RepID=A0A4R3I0H4_9GAMM|nr:hypothetical protein BCF53_11374 [Reinekea marinisedimentorum]
MPSRFIHGRDIDDAGREKFHLFRRCLPNLYTLYTWAWLLA